ncbi:MAG: ribosome-associated translation inhibitor RaiA [Bacteroidetes bacterium]|nr:MAG: ribosome-associated translation inhibitor RaiA [Bacteroidota bacterium]
MQVKIHSLKFDADKKLEEFIENKVNKLNQFYDDIISAEVILKVDKDQSLENKIAEIKLKISGTELFAKKQTKTFEESTDTAVDALRRQLTKFKEKQRGK